MGVGQAFGRLGLPRAIGLLALVMALAVWAGCGSDDSEESSSQAKQSSSGAPTKESVLEGLSGEVVFWDTTGGENNEAKVGSIFKNFTEGSGVRVTTDYYCCSLSKLIAQVESGRVQWDVAEVVTGADFQLGVEKGLFEKLDPNVVPLDQLPEGSYNEYGFQNEIYSSVIAWNTDKFPLDGDHPENLEDVFDTERFPGKRCLFNYPQYGATLEVALLADGVAPEDLYPLDVERALRKLDTIRDDIVWWDNGTKSVQYLIDGECTIGLTWNGRAYSRIKKDNAPIGMAWGNALIHTGYLAIPKGAPNMENAQALVASWILDKEGQRAYVEAVGYPTPIKGLLELTDFPEGVRPYIPIGDNVKTSTVADEDWYAENLDAVVKRFNEWLQG